MVSQLESRNTVMSKTPNVVNEEKNRLSIINLLIFGVGVFFFLIVSNINIFFSFSNFLSSTFILTKLPKCGKIEIKKFLNLI
jgi:hypothetical protein